MRLFDRRAAWSAGAAALAGLAVGVGSASACSCAPLDPRQTLAQSDAAFVGVFLSKREIGNGRSSADPALYRFRVEQRVKGALPDVLDVQSATSGASCGLEVEVGQRIGLFLERRGNVWSSNLCWQISPSRLRAAGRPLPRPDGSGAPALLVGGKFGSVRTIALDRRARTLAYGTGAGETYAFSVCPGARRVAELVFDGPRTLLAVRELPSLRRVRELALPLARPTPVSANGVHCRDADASRVFVFATDSGARSSLRVVSRLLLVRGRSVQTFQRGSALHCGFGRTKAYLGSGIAGRELISVDLLSGRARRLGTIPTLAGPLVPNPSGRYLAGIEYRATGEASRIVVVDRARQPARVRSAPLGRSNVAGDVAWLDNRRLAFMPGRGAADVGRVYDTSLRTVGRFGMWRASQSVVSGGAAYGVAAETLFRAALPNGRPTGVRTLPGPLTRALAGVPPRRPPPARWLQALW